MDTVRITSGKYRGRTIKTPGRGTHPMGERERLALFNMISPALEGALVLDAFAGSGALGIEALSRGAIKAVFVEKSPSAARVIRENLANLGLKEGVITGKVSDFNTDERFEVILADPPYDDFRIAELSGLAKLLKDDGVLVLSHPDEAPELTGLKLVKTNRYAGARISIYRRLF